MEGRSLSHWTAKEVPEAHYLEEEAHTPMHIRRNTEDQRERVTHSFWRNGGVRGGPPLVWFWEMMSIHPAVDSLPYCPWQKTFFQIKHILLFSHNVIMTPNKIIKNSLITSNNQPIFKCTAGLSNYWFKQDPYVAFIFTSSTSLLIWNILPLPLFF